MATETTSLKTKLLDEQQSSSAVHIPSDDDDAAYSEADLSSPEAVKRALKGLTSAEHAARIALQGPNEIAEKRISPFEILVRQLSSSMAIMIEARPRAAAARASPSSLAHFAVRRALARSAHTPRFFSTAHPPRAPPRFLRRSRSCSRARSRSGTTL